MTYNDIITHAAKFYQQHYQRENNSSHVDDIKKETVTINELKAFSRYWNRREK